MCFYCYILLASEDMNVIWKVKRSLTFEFEMEDLGVARNILGMKIIGNRQ